MTLGGSNSDSDFRARRPVVCSCGDHAFVGGTRGFTTMVSPEDAHLLERWRWGAEVHHGRVRVRRHDKPTRRHVNLGAAVLGIVSSLELMPDHINLDATDNRRSNLRPATNALNQRNRGAYRDRALPKGVRAGWGGRYAAIIWVGGKDVCLGYYGSPNEASAAYFAEATRLFGAYARAS